MSNANTRAFDAAPVFAALGDATRLSLLAKLRDGKPRSIATLSADAEMTRQAVTKHLQVLASAGLVGSSRVGRESRYACRPETVAKARAYLDRVSAQWDSTLGRLQKHVEDRR